jgi:hypothetical protein
MFSLLFKTVKCAALLDVHLANLRSRFTDSTGNKISLVITPGLCIYSISMRHYPIIQVSRFSWELFKNSCLLSFYTM